MTATIEFVCSYRACRTAHAERVY